MSISYIKNKQTKTNVKPFKNTVIPETIHSQIHSMQYLITDYNGRHSRWQGVRCPCSIPDGKVSDAHAAFQMARCQMPMQHSRWQGVRSPCIIPDGKVSDAHASFQMARC
ncbi:hypothetical protein ACOMHN_057533 [Nucella lapillus]